jgi:spore coat polysaccharide biosynthesis protein SpsF
MSGPDVVTIIQARTGSSRLPGKVMLPLGGRTVLARLLERVRASRLAGEVVVATTTNRADDPIATQAARLGVAVVRGHPTDLLDRHYQAARALGPRYVVKIPSDCPLIDPAVIDRVVGWSLAQADSPDYVSNLHPATHPDGNDVEVMAFPALEIAWAEARQDHEREHTTPFLWDQPGRFRLGNVRWETGLDCSRTHRYVLDYPEDYAVIRELDRELSRRDPWFGVARAVDWLDRHPRIAALNARYRGVNWYRHHLGSLRTVGTADTRPEPEPTCRV